jgi:hypothetical protein
VHVLRSVFEPARDVADARAFFVRKIFIMSKNSSPRAQALCLRQRV